MFILRLFHAGSTKKQDHHRAHAPYLKEWKTSDGSAVETTRLTESSLADVKQKISGSLGLIPFYRLTEIAPDAEWNRVTDKSLQPVTEGIELYDLTWRQKGYGGSAAFIKWRFFIDIKTNIPKRIEIYTDLYNTPQKLGA